MKSDSALILSQADLATVRAGAWRADVLRICLVPVFVLMCYQFDWETWRTSWTDIFVTVMGWLAVPVVRVRFDSFLCNGVAYWFAIACTALDVFFGSIPLLWEPKKAIHRNLMLLSSFFACLSAANLVRLALGFLLYVHGVSWFVSHEVAAGVFYFGVFLWIARRRGWGHDSPYAFACSRRN